MLTILFRTFRLPLRVNVIRAIYFSSQSQPIQASKRDVGKVVHVAIIGAPNSGKSTLINKIVDRKICAASNKVHTTTKLARAICCTEDTQIVFLDTPGVVTSHEQKKYKLPESMLEACHKGLRCAHVIGVVHDVSNRWVKDSLHPDVVNMLNSVEGIPSFLMLNKVDKLKSKRQLLAIIRHLTNGTIAGNPVPGAEKETKKKFDRGYSHFSDVFIISALNGDGVQDIKEYLVKNARPASLHYDVTEYTDQPLETIIEEAVRAKFLDFLPQEIPYKLDVLLEFFDEDKDKIMSSVMVECPSERLMRLVSGAGGGRLAQIKSSVRSDLIDVFKKQVVINIQLKVKDKPVSEIF